MKRNKPQLGEGAMAKKKKLKKKVKKTAFA